MKKWRNKILSAVLTLSLLLTSTSFAFAVGEGDTAETPQEVKITRDEIASLTASSQETQGANSSIENAFDGVVVGNSDDTIWHSKWNQTDNNRYIIVKFKDPQYINKMIYYPRNTSSKNGIFKTCTVYKSDTGAEDSWVQIAHTDEPWTTEEKYTTPKVLSFSSIVSAKYLKIVADETINDGGTVYASAAEIELYKDMSKYPTITEQPKSASYTKNDIKVQPLTVSADPVNNGDTLTYKWYKSDSKEYNGNAIENANSASYIPDVTTAGNYYYYVTVTDSTTNTTIYSDIATIGVADSQSNYAAIVDGGYYNDLSTAITEADNGDTVTVLKNIDLTSGIEITNKTITISSKEGENFTIKRGSSLSGYIFKVNNTANVTFRNITLDGGIKDNINQTGTIINVSGGQATLGEGTVLQNNNNTGTGGGAAMYITGGITNLNGATIQNNVATLGDGTIFMSGGTVNVNDCLITGNSARNGGAIYAKFGTLNLGQTENNFAVTISGNTATSNGSGIYYGKDSNSNQVPTMNINAKLNLSDEIYLDTNGVYINLGCDLAGNAPITLVGNRGIPGFINISHSNYYSSALNVFRVKDGNPAVLKPTAMDNSNLSVVRESGWSITKALENGSTYYKGIENNLYTVTGANIYTWYEKGKDGSFSTVDMNTLSNGEHTVYCVASDGTNYMVSDVATVTVKDFVPCSQAIDKFKSI